MITNDIEEILMNLFFVQNLRVTTVFFFNLNFRKIDFLKFYTKENQYDLNKL